MTEEFGYDEAFLPAAPAHLECPICLFVIRQACQTECGHRFCRKCIAKVVQQGSKKCPIDNEKLTMSKLHPDNYAQREIQNLTVVCCNKEA